LVYFPFLARGRAEVKRNRGQARGPARGRGGPPAGGGEVLRREHHLTRGVHGTGLDQLPKGPIDDAQAVVERGPDFARVREAVVLRLREAVVLEARLRLLEEAEARRQEKP